jgi:hypothetical protein
MREMRAKTISTYALAAMAVLFVPGAANGQDSAWAYFESDGLMQAGTVTADGDQLILKCDERGDGTVAAVFFSTGQLKQPGSRPIPRDIRLRFDNGAPRTVVWPYYEQTAIAMNTRRERQLPEFLGWLADANRLEAQFDPVDGGPITLEFAVSGARDAIARVYEACGDSTNPLG